MNNRSIYFIYDSECPICKYAAEALRIKQDYGELILISARNEPEHPLIKQINLLNMDLDEGMVIYDEDQYYHGKDALKFMSKYADTKDIFNISNKLFYGSTFLNKLIYPNMRAIRNLLIRRKNITPIDNLECKSEPIFKPVFGDSWTQLPSVLKKHYANHPYTNDITVVEGHLDIMCRGPIKFLAPLLWLSGSVPPVNKKNVKVTVNFESDLHSKRFHFNRLFDFNKAEPYQFNSAMLHTKDDEVIEIMRLGLCWRSRYYWDGENIQLKHKGYAWYIFGILIPLPLSLILGAGNATETAIDDQHFKMQVNITHPLWGKIYEYRGSFKIKDNIK